jgi:hypothetical protein
VLLSFGICYPSHTFDPDCRLYPPDVDCELVSLVSFPRYLRGDCGGFPMVPEVDIVSHYQYPGGCPHEVRVTCTG